MLVQVLCSRVVGDLWVLGIWGTAPESREVDLAYPVVHHKHGVVEYAFLLVGHRGMEASLGP